MSNCDDCVHAGSMEHGAADDHGVDINVLHAEQSSVLDVVGLSQLGCAIFALGFLRNVRAMNVVGPGRARCPMVKRNAYPHLATDATLVRKGRANQRPPRPETTGGECSAHGSDREDREHISSEYVSVLEPFDERSSPQEITLLDEGTPDDITDVVHQNSPKCDGVKRSKCLTVSQSMRRCKPLTDIFLSSKLPSLCGRSRCARICGTQAAVEPQEVLHIEYHYLGLHLICYRFVAST